MVFGLPGQPLSFTKGFLGRDSTYIRGDLLGTPFGSKLSLTISKSVLAVIAHHPHLQEEWRPSSSPRKTSSLTPITHPSRDWAQDVGSYPSWVIMPVSLAEGHLTSFPLKDAQERRMYIMAHRPLCLRLTLMTGDE